MSWWLVCHFVHHFQNINACEDSLNLMLQKPEFGSCRDSRLRRQNPGPTVFDYLTISVSSELQIKQTLIKKHLIPEETFSIIITF